MFHYLIPAIMLAGLTLHVTGVALESTSAVTELAAIDKNVRKRAIPEVDHYDDFDRIFGANRLERDQNGGFNYGEPFRYSTLGGTIAGAAYSGIEPLTRPNVALLIFSAAGALTPSKKCAKLQSFGYGCTTTHVQPTANLPLRCFVTVEAIGMGGEQQEYVIKSEKFEYTPVLKSAPLGIPSRPIFSEMRTATLDLPTASKFRVSADILPDVDGLLESAPSELRALLKPLVEFLRPLLAAKDTLPALLLDNITYTQYETDSKCNA